MITLEQLAGWSALLAAGATVVGAVLLALFFRWGEPWGTLNDLASIVLMLAMIPVAIEIASLETRSPFPGPVALGAAFVGILGMIAAAGFQAALVARIRTYEQLLARTLGAGAVVGAWYLLVAAFSIGGALPGWSAVLAAVSGLGFIAVAYGFAIGRQRHPASVVGGIGLLVASTSFLTWFGIATLSGDLPIPAGNL